VGVRGDPIICRVAGGIHLYIHFDLYLWSMVCEIMGRTPPFSLLHCVLAREHSKMFLPK
jgi:hypothetical protein